MTRDAGLEDLVEEHLAKLHGLARKPMFGGLAWMWRGNLLCAARDDGLLVRLGKGHDGWALKQPDVTAMMSGTRPMTGWVRATPDAAGDDDVRARLLDGAIAFVRGLPAKP